MSHEGSGLSYLDVELTTVHHLYNVVIFLGDYSLLALLAYNSVPPALGSATDIHSQALLSVQ